MRMLLLNNWNRLFYMVEVCGCHLCRRLLKISLAPGKSQRQSTQTRLLSWVPGRPLPFLLNLGAIFRGAQLNNQFRVKNIRPKDYSTYSINIISNATLDSSKDTPVTLFPRRTKLGNTKTLTFKTSEDISFNILYSPDSDLPSDISPSILDAKITGVPEKIEKLKGTNECHDPTVKVSIKLTDAGLIEVLHSEVQCEIREKKNLADKFKGLFGGGKEKE